MDCFRSRHSTHSDALSVQKAGRSATKIMGSFSVGYLPLSLDSPSNVTRRIASVLVKVVRSQ